MTNTTTRIPVYDTYSPSSDLFIVVVVTRSWEEKAIQCSSKTEAIRTARNEFKKSNVRGVEAFNSLYRNDQPSIYYRVKKAGQL